MNPDLSLKQSTLSDQLLAIDVFSELLASAYPGQLAQKLTEQLRELTGARTVNLVAHPDGEISEEMLYVCPERRKNLFMLEELGELCQSGTQGLPQRVCDLKAQDPVKPILERKGVESFLRFPLKVSGEPLATLLLFDMPGLDRIDETAKIVTHLSPIMALALKNSFAHERIERQARELEARVVERTADLDAVNKALMLEVGEHRRAEDTLRGSEQRFRRAVEEAPFPLMIHAEDGEVIALSRAWTELSGYALKDIPSIREWTLKAYGSHGQPSVIEEIMTLYSLERRKAEGEFSIVCSDGATRIWDFSSISLGRLPDGRRIAMSMASDVTERKREEEALVESERKLNEAQNLAQLGHWSWNLKSGKVEWSDEVYRIFRLDPASFTPTIDSILELSPWPEDHVRDKLLVQTAMSSREKGSYEQKFLRPDKSIGYYHSTFQGKYSEDGELHAIVGTIMDITERKKAEEALQESESRLSFALQTSHAGAWELNLQDRSARRTLMHDQIFGYKELLPSWTYEDFLGHVLPEDRPFVDASFKRAVATQSDWNFECRIRRVDGELRWIGASGGHELGPEGKPVRISGIVQDVTARKTAELEIARVNRALRILSETNKVLIRATDEATLLNEVCRIVVEIGGYRLAWVGMAIEDEAKTVRPVACAGFNPGYVEAANISWGDNERGNGPAGKSIRTGQPCFAQDITTASSFAPWREAAIRNGYRSILSLPLACDGKALGNLAIYSAEPNAFDAKEIDVLKELADNLGFGIGALRTRAKREEAEESLRLTRFSIDCTSDAVFWVTPDARIADANLEACSSLGYTKEELLKLSLPDINPNFDMERWRQHFSDLRQHGSIKLESSHIDKNGRIIPVEVLANYLKFGDKEYSCGFVRDITERKRAEAEKAKLESQLQQAQKMDAIGRLAGGVAHDFNNMLGVILGHVEMALDQLSPEQDLHTNVMEIRKAANRSADLTRQLLAFARRQTVSPKVIDLNETVEGMLKILRRLIGENIDLAWLPAATPCKINIDPTQVDQVLANLCVNARDAIDGVGKIEIETGVAEIDEASASPLGGTPGRYVVLTVSDDGCGMSKEILDKLFEPFFTTKELGKGTGLGLATVYGIVKQNAGFISVDSEPGRGASFKVHLPLYASEAPSQEEGSQAPAAKGSETVLLVEDEQMLLDIAKLGLENAGFKVLAVTEPAEALRIAKESKGEIHLLITDVVMPKMNGKDLERSLRALRPKLKCLFMSGYTSDVLAPHGILDEGVNFIQKPFLTQELATKAREALDRK